LADGGKPARGGEGVFGLRRAFTLAGAQNLVLSLWSGSDQETARLMERFYHHLPGEGTPQRALLRAQREYLETARKEGRVPHPFFWAAFVASGSGLGLEK
jgi:CHAT domain-containing protein